MSPAQAGTGAPAIMQWGSGDLLTIVIAIFVFLIGLIVHRRALKQKNAHERGEFVWRLMATALPVGPLLMILIDPFLKMVWDIDLLRIVMTQTRVTLWLACFLALVNMFIAFFRAPL